MNRNINRYRITARIRTVYGTEKTVSLRCTIDELEKKLKQFFNATEYIIYKIGDLEFYHDQTFTEIKQNLMKTYSAALYGKSTKEVMK